MSELYINGPDGPLLLGKIESMHLESATDDMPELVSFEAEGSFSCEVELTTEAVEALNLIPSVPADALDADVIEDSEWPDVIGGDTE